MTLCRILEAVQYKTYLKQKAFGNSQVEYLRKKMITKEAVEDLQFCFVWIRTVA